MTTIPKQGRMIKTLGDCEFCAQVHRKYTISNRILYQSDRLTAWPSLGALTPGHILILPNQHYRGCLAMEEGHRREMMQLVDACARVLDGRYTGLLVGEHGNQAAQGSGNGASEFAPTCVDHAHMHVIPVFADFHQALERYRSVLGQPDMKLTKEELQTRDLALGEYQLLGDGDDHWVLWTRPHKAGSQFIRKVGAELLGKPREYNWREFPNYQTIAETRDLLCGVYASLPENLVAGWDAIQAKFDLGHEG